MRELRRIKATATVIMNVWVDDRGNGSVEYDDVDEVLEVEEYEVIE